MGQHMYNTLYVKAQLMASDDEFQVRCREAFETNTITEDEYKRLLAFRRECHGPKGNPVGDSKNTTGVQ